MKAGRASGLSSDDCTGMAISNEGTYTASCPFSGTTAANAPVDDAAGQNVDSEAYAFEERVTQESGTH